jgi:hypothetical protein
LNYNPKIQYCQPFFPYIFNLFSENFKAAHCLKTNLAEKGVCLKTKNLAQITMVPTGHGGTNGVRHENQEENLRENLQTLPTGEQKRQEKNP